MASERAFAKKPMVPALGSLPLAPKRNPFAVSQRDARGPSHDCAKRSTPTPVRPHLDLAKIPIYPPLRQAGRPSLPVQAKLDVGAVDAPQERDADAIADRVMRMPSPSAGGVEPSEPSERGTTVQRACCGIPAAVRAPVPAHTVDALTTGGHPLPPAVQAFYEARFGLGLGDVRLHTGPLAAAYATEAQAHAFTVGNHIWMRREQGAQPSPLLAHELAHVAQYAATGRVVLGRKEAEEEQDPDAKVSLGVLDNALVGHAAAELLGPAHWAILREFLRGVQGGLLSASPDQLDRIQKKSDSFGAAEAAKYVAGYGLGIVEGLWISVEGLVEAVVTLVKLPYDVQQFLLEKFPDLAARYGPRIAQFLTEGGGIQERLRKLVAGALKDPVAAARQLDAVMQGIKGMALAQVRALGHQAAGKVLALLEEPWFDYGRDIGKIAGQVLFEVLLAVASDAIANVAKEALAVAGRIAARAAEAAVELFSKIRGLLAKAFEWLETAGRKLAGQASEFMEWLKALVARLRALMEDLAGEGGLVADTGTGAKIRVPDVKGPQVLESRAAKPPRGPGSQALDDLLGRPTGGGQKPPVPKMEPEPRRLRIPDPESEIPADLLAKRRKILESLDEFVRTDPALSKVREIDPQARFGVQGSVVRGRVGNPRKPTFGQPFQPEEFDLDFFVVSEKLPKPTKVTPLAGARDRLARRFPDVFEGLKFSGQGFSVKVFRPGEQIPGTFMFFE